MKHREVETLSQVSRLGLRAAGLALGSLVPQSVLLAHDSRRPPPNFFLLTGIFELRSNFREKPRGGDLSRLLETKGSVYSLAHFM